MKTVIQITCQTLLLAGLLAGAAGQTTEQSPDRRSITRIYENREAEGVRVWVYQMDGPTRVLVDPAKSFTKGARLEVELESNFKGYLYIINVAPGGPATLLYPLQSEIGKNEMQPGGHYLLSGFTMDGEKGVEVLRVVLAEQQIARYEKAADQGGSLGESAAPPAGEAQAGGVAEDEPAAPPQSGEGIRSRDIDLAPIAEEDPARGMTLVARLRPAGPPGKSTLDTGVFTFDIRLRKV